jgi:hypothetical protein
MLQTSRISTGFTLKNTSISRFPEPPPQKLKNPRKRVTNKIPTTLAVSSPRISSPPFKKKETFRRQIKVDFSCFFLISLSSPGVGEKKVCAHSHKGERKR